MPARGRRHRVVIEHSPTKEPNAEGQLIDTWRTHADAYAEIIPLGSSEKLRASELYGNITHRVRLPYIRGLDRTMRIRFANAERSADRFLNIKSITNMREQNRQLDLLCEEPT